MTQENKVYFFKDLETLRGVIKKLPDVSRLMR